MTRKKRAAPAVTPGEAAKRTARVVANPSIAHAAIMSTFAKPLFGETDMGELCDTLEARATAVKGGDLSSAENMLVAQAATLNLLFLDLTRRSTLNMGEHINAAERYMRLALKAQAQCRATLETLAALKSPPVVFAKQANIAAGPQQVNNGAVTREGRPARAGNPESVPNGLLEANDGQGERLDAGTAGAASGGDKAVEAVGAIDGPAHG